MGSYPQGSGVLLSGPPEGVSGELFGLRGRPSEGRGFFPNPAPSRLHLLAAPPRATGAGAFVAVITGFAEFVLKRRTG
ncbi:hypothetical protein GCM10009837_86420 [Streptomyces durmitorensis]